MDLYIYLIPITIFLALIGLAALFWAIKNDQYEDLKSKGKKLIFIQERKDS